MKADIPNDFILDSIQKPGVETGSYQSLRVVVPMTGTKDFHLEFQNHGLVLFADAWVLQQQSVARIKNMQRSGVVLGFQHPTVVTLGVRAHKLVDQTALALPASVDVVKIDRGGMATFHNPGQLVIYPIVPIGQLQMGVFDFVKILENVTVNVLTEIGVRTLPDCGEPGVFTAEGKIASIGIRVKDGVSYHGLSINISNDLKLFSSFPVCGVQNPTFDRVLNWSKTVSIDEVFSRWTHKFANQMALFLTQGVTSQ
jgi:lipoyl(octanoyl) transferase